MFIKNDTIESKLKLIKKVKTSNMHIFNNKGVIQKYNNAEEILKEWYNYRLEKYTIRKEYLISKLVNELNLLEYKAKFIEYVLDEKIIVFKQKREVIINKLVEFDFPKLAVSNEEKTYDYITNISLFSLTKEKIDELNEKLKNKEEELENVKSKTELEMWKIELNEFKDVYKKWYKKRNENFNCDINKKKNLKKSSKKSSKKTNDI